MGDLKRALELEEAVHSARQRLLPIDHPDLLRAMGNLAITRNSVGDLEGALELSASLLERQLLVASRLHSEAPRLARAGAELELLRLSKLLSWSGETLTAAEESGLPNLDPLVFSVLESMRSVSASSSEVVLAASLDSELAGLRDSIAQARLRVSQASLGPSDDAPTMEAWRAQLFALSEERDRLQGELREKLARRELQFEVVSPASIAEELSERSALVSFFRCERRHDGGPAVDSLLAFVLTPGNPVRRVELGPVDELVELTSAWRKSIGRSAGRGVGLELRCEFTSSARRIA